VSAGPRADARLLCPPASTVTAPPAILTVVLNECYAAMGQSLTEEELFQLIAEVSSDYGSILRPSPNLPCVD